MRREDRIRLADCRIAIQHLMEVSEAEMLGRALERRCSRPRQMAMALAREFTDASLAKIGAHFGRDHSTVLYAIRRVAAAESTDPKFKAAMDSVRRILNAAAQKGDTPGLVAPQVRTNKHRVRNAGAAAVSNSRHGPTHGANGHRGNKNARASDAASPRPCAFRHSLPPFGAQARS